MQVNWKKLILPNIPYFFIALFATKLGQAIRLAPGSYLSGKIMHFMEGMVLAFESSMPSFHPSDLCVGTAVALGIRLAVYIKGKNAKKFRKDMEYGSARWGGYEDIKPYIDPVFANNIILTQTESLTMNNRPADPKTARNKNVLIIGGSGSGKTRFWLKPNLMQCTSKKYPVSFVVTDPKGSIVTECGKMLLRFGYRLKIMNTINFKKSMHYNPFAYIHSEKDIFMPGFSFYKYTKEVLHMRKTTIELSLCGRCAGVFYHSPTHRIKRVDPLQVIKEECMCCRVKNGYNYRVIELSSPVSYIFCRRQYVNATSTILH